MEDESALLNLPVITWNHSKPIPSQKVKVYGHNRFGKAIEARSEEVGRWKDPGFKLKV